MSRKIILCIEDSSEEVKLVEYIVRSRSIDVDCRGAVGGQEGLNLARQERPDLILVDFHLPDATGWEVLEKIKADNKLKNTPVVLMGTSYLRGDAPCMTPRRFRPDAWLDKPVDIQDLADTIRKLLDVR